MIYLNKLLLCCHLCNVLTVTTSVKSCSENVNFISEQGTTQTTGNLRFDFMVVAVFTLTALPCDCLFDGQGTLCAA